jgi:osmoprotectant transport system substrate-binding protein
MVRRIALLFTVVLVVVAAAACGSGTPALVVGSANFTESELLMEIYAAALRKTGLAVQTRPRLGPREITNRAIADGSITVMPEYTGNLLRSFDPRAGATTAEEVYTALKRALPAGLEILQPSQADDSDVLVMTRPVAAAYGVSSMDQLGPHCSELTLGAAGEWAARWQDKIAQLYGCRFREIRSTDAGGPVTLQALRSGQVQVANLFTTSPEIAANGWVELADPKHMYPAQRIVPLVRAGTLNQAAIDELNAVSAKLTTPTLTELNRRISRDHAAPADIAREFVS